MKFPLRYQPARQWTAVATLLSILSAPSAWAQESAAAGKPAGFDITSAGSLIVVFAFLLMLVIAIIIVRRRLEDQRVREAMADAAFEMEVMARFRNTDTSDFPVHPAVHQTAPSPIMDSAPYRPEVIQQDTFDPNPKSVADAGIKQAATPTMAGESNFERADVAAAGALSQLRNAGMLDDIDGYTELNGNPQGAAILRMKDGRRGLLIPYHETEAFTRRNLRRYDLLIFVGRDGKAVVVTALETAIADRISSRF